MAYNRPQWVEQFETNGYAVIEDFATAADCDELKAEMYKVMNGLDITTEHKTVFSAGTEERREDDYFYNSGDKVRYFFEKGALNEKGDLVVPKEQSLKKVGLALHWYNDVFKRFSFSDKMKTLARSFGLEDAAITNSMYLFNNPNMHGEIGPHQDSSFLWMDPLKLYAVWLAVDDATEENGCLWFVPGSHIGGEMFDNKEMLRTVKDVDDQGCMYLTHTGCFLGEKDSRYIPCPVKKGSLVLIHGLVVHMNESNRSDTPANVYTLHFMEQKGTKLSSDNWLQPTEDLPFTALYSN